MPRHLSNGLVALRAQLAEYQAAHSNLEDRVAKIGREIESVEALLKEFDGGTSAGGKRRGRPAKATKVRGARRAKGAGRGQRVAGQDLASVITKVLSSASKPMKIADIAVAAKKAGYKSASPKFDRIVGMRLSTDKRFKRAGYGQYTIAK